MKSADPPTLAAAPPGQAGGRPPSVPTRCAGASGSRAADMPVRASNSAAPIKTVSRGCGGSGAGGGAPPRRSGERRGGTCLVAPTQQLGALAFERGSVLAADHHALQLLLDH